MPSQKIFLVDIQCQLYGLLITEEAYFIPLEHCMKRFCTSLREHAPNVNNFKEKKIVINKKELKLHFGKRFSKTFAKDRNHC